MSLEELYKQVQDHEARISKLESQLDWRNKPATAAQKSKIFGKGLKVPKNLTRGEAARIIEGLER